MNVIEMRDNNFHRRIIFQVFEHCLSILYSLWLFHCYYLTHTTFTRTMFIFHSLPLNRCFFLLYFVFVFSLSIKSTFCHIVECGFDTHSYWYIRFDKPSYTIILTAWNRTFILHIWLYYLSIYLYIIMLDGLSLLFYRFQVCRLQSIHYIIFMCPSLTHTYTIWSIAVFNTRDLNR